MEALDPSAADVWVRSPTTAAWVPGTVLKTNASSTRVVVDGSPVNVHPDEVLPRNRDDGAAPQLMDLPMLHTASILHTLRRRFQDGDIYTLAGSILIAVNPHRDLPGLYNMATMQTYRHRVGPFVAFPAEAVRYQPSPVVARAKTPASVSPRPVSCPPRAETPPHVLPRPASSLAATPTGMAAPPDLPPHVYSVAAEMYSAVVGSGRSQTVCVSGESGAGKTETCKHIMGFLTASSKITQLDGMFVESVGGHGEQVVDVETLVLESNPILEAFGCAATQRNSNSSRFGKCIKLRFSPTGHLQGAAIDTYLLEKVRVTDPAPGSLNYHSLLYLAHGAPADERRRLMLDDTPFRIAGGDVATQLPCDPTKGYTVTTAALHKVGMPPGDVQALWAVLAGLLHLGNVRFDGEDTCSTPPEATASLERVASLWGVGADALHNALTHKVLVAGGTVVEQPLSAAKANSALDAFIRHTYAQAFQHLVALLNSRLAGGDVDSPTIGILDIFGFECFPVNSFEQLCINYANEALQQHFNAHVFQEEQRVYQEEGVTWEDVDFPRNDAIIELITSRAKPPGVFALLDQECLLPRGTDASFARKLYLRLRGNPHFDAPPAQQAASQFTVVHFAGKVTYSTEGWAVKNKDVAPATAFGLLAASDVACVVAPPQQAAQASRMTATVCSSFHKALAGMVAGIAATAPHFIRCLKPNTCRSPDDFDDVMVETQLQYCGVLQATHLARAGFPVRFDHREFVRLYGRLAPGPPPPPPVMPQLSRIAVVTPESQAADAAKAACRDVVEKLGIEGIVVGATKVFLRHEGYTELEALSRERQAVAVVTLQAAWRGAAARKAWLAWRAAVVVLQAHQRGKLTRRRLLDERRRAAATKVAAWWRGTHRRAQFVALVRGTAVIQARFRARRLRRLLAKHAGSVTVLQAHVRRRFTAARWCTMRGAASTLQAWTRHVARLQAAKEEASKRRAGRTIGCQVQAWLRRKALLAALAVVHEKVAAGRIGHMVLRWRQQRAGREFRKVYIPARTIQRHWRVHCQRVQAERLLLDASACIVTAAVRLFVERGVGRRIIACATKVQRCWRSFVWRQVHTAAATPFQRLARQWLARRVSAAMAIQHWACHHMWRKRREAVAAAWRRGATLVQATWRGFRYRQLRRQVAADTVAATKGDTMELDRLLVGIKANLQDVGEASGDLTTKLEETELLHRLRAAIQAARVPQPLERLSNPTVDGVPTLLQELPQPVQRGQELSERAPPRLPKAFLDGEPWGGATRQSLEPARAKGSRTPPRLWKASPERELRGGATESRQSLEPAPPTASSRVLRRKQPRALAVQSPERMPQPWKGREMSVGEEPASLKSALEPQGRVRRPHTSVSQAPDSVFWIRAASDTPLAASSRTAQPSTAALVSSSFLSPQGHMVGRRASTDRNPTWEAPSPSWEEGSPVQLVTAAGKLPPLPPLSSPLFRMAMKPQGQASCRCHAPPFADENPSPVAAFGRCRVCDMPTMCQCGRRHCVPDPEAPLSALAAAIRAVVSMEAAVAGCATFKPEPLSPPHRRVNARRL